MAGGSIIRNYGGYYLIIVRIREGIIIGINIAIIIIKQDKTRYQNNPIIINAA